MDAAFLKLAKNTVRTKFKHPKKRARKDNRKDYTRKTSSSYNLLLLQLRHIAKKITERNKTSIQ